MLDTAENTSPLVTSIPVAARTRVFLTARWQALVMINFRVEPEILQPLVPVGTELDFFGGEAYVSLVGFLFRDTRVLGIPVPWHVDFEEFNLRFYVRRSVGRELRRGVCFVRELVPRAAIAAVANWCYNESFQSLPMRYAVDLPAIMRAEPSAHELRLSYHWRDRRTWHGVTVKTQGAKQRPREGSLAEFIAEHYWGYSRQRDGGTAEYQVEHSPWNVWEAEPLAWEGDVGGFYGEPWTNVLRGQPSCAFVADGSAVKVFQPRRIT